MKTLQEIESVVCEVFSVTSEFVHEKRNGQNRSTYRYIITYLSRVINGRFITFEQIGKYFEMSSQPMNYGYNSIIDAACYDQILRENINECLKNLQK